MTVAESQEKHEHILEAEDGESTDQMWARAGEFTNNVCYDTREKYALIRKTGGRVCGPGVDCDKIIERTAPHKIYDLVRAAGSPDAEAIFDYTGHDGKPADFAEPKPYQAGPEPPEPEPPDPPAPTWPTYESVGGDDGANKISRFCEKDYRTAGYAGLDGNSGCWIGRTYYDFLTGKVTPVEASIEKHKGEWRTALNERRASEGKPPITNWG